MPISTYTCMCDRKGQVNSKHFMFGCISCTQQVVSCTYVGITFSVTSKMPLQEYPFKARTRHGLDYSRQFPHLRARTNAFAALLRIRNTATMAVHDYLQVGKERSLMS